MFKRLFFLCFKYGKKRRDREVITKGKNPSTPSLLFLCPVWLGALHKQVNDLDRLSGLPIQITYGQRPQYYKLPTTVNNILFYFFYSLSPCFSALNRFFSITRFKADSISNLIYPDIIRQQTIISATSF